MSQNIFYDEKLICSPPRGDTFRPKFITHFENKAILFMKFSTDILTEHMKQHSFSPGESMDVFDE